MCCKKANGAMKTSSVDFNTPSPMESNNMEPVLQCLRKNSFSPGEVGNGGKREICSLNNGRSRTLEGKISVRSSKDQLVKKTFISACRNDKCFPVETLPDVERECLQTGWGETV
ncbi:hypothetical protein TNCV_2503351 [Trichonephila clavipes]|nr:hypothetical protein TNCV_2503351 [Trichonephila clavipes]